MLTHITGPLRLVLSLATAAAAETADDAALALRGLSQRLDDLSARLDPVTAADTDWRISMDWVGDPQLAAAKDAIARGLATGGYLPRPPVA